MRGKNKILIATLAMLISISAVLVLPATTQQWSAKMQVTPLATVDPALSPGSTFTVAITLTDIADLYGFEFKLHYDTSVLSTNPPSVEIGDVFGPEIIVDYHVWYKRVIDPMGLIWLAVTQELGSVEGVTLGKGETGLLATITFTVDSYGTTTLDLYDVKLSNPLGGAIGLYGQYDGYFSNVPIAFVDLVDWKAKEEHNKFDPDKDDDGMQSFYSKVCNFGTQQAVVKVRFDIYDINMIHQGFTESPTVTVNAGETLYMPDATWPWGNMAPQKRYYVQAQCWYGTTTPDTAGLSIANLEYFTHPPPTWHTEPPED